jgi:competence protein ComFC
MEPISIHPRSLPGKFWDAGFCLDVHTTSSEFLGHNAYGHPEFDTVYSPIGKCLYRLKYRGDRSAMGPIVDALKRFLDEWKPRVDLLVPIPHSTPGRTLVPDMASKLAVLTGMPVCDDCIERRGSSKQLKDVYDRNERLELLKGAFVIRKDRIEGKRLLLLDDLFRSGATVGTIAEAFQEAGARKVFLLTVTRTRSNR